VSLILASLKYLKCPSSVSSIPDLRLNRWPQTHCRVSISFTSTSFSQAVFESRSSIFSSWILSCNIFSNFLVPSSFNRMLLAPSCCRPSIARSKNAFDNSCGPTVEILFHLWDLLCRAGSVSHWLLFQLLV